VYPVNSEALADRVRKAGGSATLVEYAEMGHIRIVLSLAKPFRRGGGVLDEVAEFVEANTTAALQAARPSRADADKLAVP
jgi:acetyl esterase/lipase